MTLDPVSFIPALLFAFVLASAIVSLLVYATINAPDPDETAWCTRYIGARYELRRSGVQIQAQESELFDWQHRV